MSQDSKRASSPFHAGEMALQEQAGKRDTMEVFGRRVIRDHMPDQHRQFFEQLPFVVLGSVDDEGWPWASIIAGQPGFMQSADARTLHINGAPAKGDPLSKALRAGNPIGVLGIEMPTRRRNRMNARISATGASGFTLLVDQSFGNCPQYIQTREVSFLRPTDTVGPDHAFEDMQTLDKAATALIETADTFFVASYLPVTDDPITQGVDVSHRGGRSGFVKVEGNTLTIPDYSGNFHFNTLGNFLLNPKAGLLFTDFETGTTLSLTGRVELLGGDHPEISCFEGAERGWRFKLDRAVRITDALPLRATFGAWSPSSLMAGDWQQADARRTALEGRNNWRSFRIARIKQESSSIRSFWLEPADGQPVLPFAPGQFLSLRLQPDGDTRPLIRSYTVSSGPSEDMYRISVKREEGGDVSRYLHDRMKPGDVLEIRAPRGSFTLDTGQHRPAVLLAAGVGITPMVSMAKQVLHEGLRTRHLRPLTIVHSARTDADRAFRDELTSLAKASGNGIRYISLLSQPETGLISGRDCDFVGRITSDVLRTTLPLDDYDFYICGPAEFMQDTYDILHSLGVPDHRIATEGFGPSSLTRDKAVPDTPQAPPEEPDLAVVSFTRSGIEHSWTKGDPSLLELAEAHGLTPEFSCRTGSCGSCATRKISGKVAYRTPPTAAHAEDQVLICCAIPAVDGGDLELEL